ncbi:MAG: hypothetical protein DME97_12500 [Verrucomicrobia bacterium]|nr:MAG: hypothetical protein DME97_12500 [Verrucomicrobiota bacterium]
MGLIGEQLRGEIKATGRGDRKAIKGSPPGSGNSLSLVNPRLRRPCKIKEITNAPMRGFLSVECKFLRACLLPEANHMMQSCVHFQ